MISDMVQVSKEEFYAIVGPLDVCLSIEGKYPYRSIYKLRYGKVVGEHKDEDDSFFVNSAFKK